jgi:hypothetical protein
MASAGWGKIKQTKKSLLLSLSRVLLLRCKGHDGMMPWGLDCTGLSAGGILTATFGVVKGDGYGNGRRRWLRGGNCGLEFPRRNPDGSDGRPSQAQLGAACCVLISCSQDGVCTLPGLLPSSRAPCTRISSRLASGVDILVLIQPEYSGPGS